MLYVHVLSKNGSLCFIFAKICFISFMLNTQAYVCDLLSVQWVFVLTSQIVLWFSIRDLKTTVGTWKGDGEGILPGKKGTEFTKCSKVLFNLCFNEYLRTNIFKIMFYFMWQFPHWVFIFLMCWLDACQ